MTKKPFIVFGLVLVFLAVLIPLWAFTTDGDPAKGRMEVPENLKKGQTLFDTNCGTCHTLYAAGTDGDFGPNLDQQLAPAGTATGTFATRDMAASVTRRRRGLRRRRRLRAPCGRSSPPWGW